MPGQGEFFSLKFLSKGKWTKCWRTRTRTTQVIPWSLAFGCRQKCPSPEGSFCDFSSDSEDEGNDRAELKPSVVELPKSKFKPMCRWTFFFGFSLAVVWPQWSLYSHRESLRAKPPVSNVIKVLQACTYKSQNTQLFLISLVALSLANLLCLFLFFDYFSCWA